MNMSRILSRLPRLAFLYLLFVLSLITVWYSYRYFVPRVPLSTTTSTSNNKHHDQSTIQTLSVHKVGNEHQKLNQTNELNQKDKLNQKDNWNRTSSCGYVLSTHFNDEMTGSTANLMSLQCWVSYHLVNNHHCVRLLEPSIHSEGSMLGFQLGLHDYGSLKQKTSPYLYDIFDYDEWNKIVKDSGYAPLTNWTDFIKDHPKKMILVFHTWAKGDFERDVTRNHTSGLVATHGFDVVRKVEINFRTSGRITPEEYYERIYGPYKPEDVVVVFQHWGGMEYSPGEFRISLKGTRCSKNIRLFHPSQTVMKDCDTYTKKYLGGTDARYLAVMVRIEHYHLHHGLGGLPLPKLKEALRQLFSRIKTKVNEIKKEKDISKVLIFTDVGKYGCRVFRMYYGDPRVAVRNMTREFYTSMSMDWDEFDKTFEDTASFNLPGYIAIVQKTLAARATCLLQIGGGSFQGTTAQLYRELRNRQAKEQCLSSIH